MRVLPNTNPLPPAGEGRLAHSASGVRGVRNRTSTPLTLPRLRRGSLPLPGGERGQ